MIVYKDEKTEQLRRLEALRKERLESVRLQALKARARERAKQKIKKEAKKKIKKAVVKTGLKVLMPILIAIAPYLIIIGLAFLCFLMLIYYTCEGGGLLPWLLRRTALGGLCGM